MQTLNYDEKFTVLCLTDNHLDGREVTDKLKDDLKGYLKNVRPSLVVMGGDNVNAGADSDGIKDLVYLEELAQLFEENKQHWAPVLGNHDRDRRINDEPLGLKAQSEMLRRYARGGYCLFGDEGDFSLKENISEWHSLRVGNYALEIKSETDRFQLFFLDSGQHEAPGSLDNGYITSAQVEWYKKTADAPNIIFNHQPLPEHVFAALTALDETGCGNVSADKGMGANGESPIICVQREGINFGLYHAASDRQCTHIFCGHNHSNNSVIKYGNLYMGYMNRTTGGALNATLITIEKGNRVSVRFCTPSGEISDGILGAPPQRIGKLNSPRITGRVSYSDGRAVSAEVKIVPIIPRNPEREGEPCTVAMQLKCDKEGKFDTGRAYICPREYYNLIISADGREMSRIVKNSDLITEEIFF